MAPADRPQLNPTAVRTASEERGLHPTFNRTKQAATVDRATRWGLIEAIAADAVDNDLPISGIKSQLAACSALTEAGNEYAESTVHDLCVVAKFDQESTPTQRQLWRTYGWSNVRLAAKAGWSQKEVAALLSGDHKSLSDIQRALDRSKGRDTPAPPAPLDDRWAAWVNHQNALLMEGARLDAETEEAGGVGGHAHLGRMIYHQIVERQLDAEIRTLLDEAEQ